MTLRWGWAVLSMPSALLYRWTQQTQGVRHMTNVPPQDSPGQAGYQQPQPGYMPPPGGMAPQPVYAGGVPAVSADARQWAMFSHLGGIIFGFLAPLIIMLTKGNEDSFVKEQSTEALNFQITLAIAYVVSLILMIVLIGILTFFVAWVLAIVFSIMGGM